MKGPQLLARSMGVATTGGRGKAFAFERSWQYHPRSDRHSKIACWGIVFDLLIECALFRRHAEEGKIGFGINHPMTRFSRRGTKDLDLVICPTADTDDRGDGSFRRMVDTYGIQLTPAEMTNLLSLPDIASAKPSTVLLALEAKACMTAFGKARPRLYDELNSSHETIHADTLDAIAAGLAMINVADRFVSPILNRWRAGEHVDTYNEHDQPKDAKSVLDKLDELPRRNRLTEHGFDAFGAILIDCRNDGSQVRLHEGYPAPKDTDSFNYAQMIRRLCRAYSSRNAAL